MADLITLTEYKQSESIQSVKDDTRIESLIDSVSQLVKTYCGNSIVDFFNTAAEGQPHTNTKTEALTVNWSTNVLQLTESPVVLVHTVQERETFTSAYKTLGATDYFVDSATDCVYRVTSSGYNKNWPTGPEAIKITYNAGYASTPADLKLAVIDLVTYYLKDEHKARQTLAGASIQNQGSTSQRNNVAFPDHIKRVLDLYKTY